ncbi:MAG: hypothetical protein ACRDHF_10155 [Tepidiformaceae bacterium]
MNRHAMSARLFRVILPAADMERSVAFYTAVLEDPGRRVSPERHHEHSPELRPRVLRGGRP